jgi:serine/threonine-protein kinase RsbW
LEQKYFNNTYLCISEAVVNSIKHGNKYDLNKTISIVVNCDETELNILIEDEGNGFDLNKISDPTCKKI